MRTAVSLLALLLAGSPAAAARVKPRPAPAPAPAPEAAELKVPSLELLGRAAELYGALEYDKVIALTNTLLQRDDLPLQAKLEAHRLNGSAKAVAQDPLDAEQPFRLLLRLQLEYDLPRDTPPKILAVFRKVQSEERELHQQAERFDREKKIQGLKFLDEPPRAVNGGRPLKFSLRLRDPGAAVDSVKVPYRRAGQADYSSLALSRDDEGRWVGQLPAEYTADERGFTLEYYVESADAKGPLLALGNAALPLRAEVAAGALPAGRPPVLHRSLFWASLGLTVGAAATAGGLALATMFYQRDYRGKTGPVMGSELVALERQGQSAALGTNVALVTTGVLAVLTAVLIPFTDFEAASP